MTASPGGGDCPRRDTRNAFRPVADEGGLIVVPSRSTVEVLNPVGARVFALLDGSHTREQIVRTVIDEFDVDETQARAHVDAFLADLEERGLLARPAGEAGAIDE